MSNRTNPEGAKQANTHRYTATVLAVLAVSAPLAVLAFAADASAHHNGMIHPLCDPRIQPPVRFDLATGANGVNGAGPDPIGAPDFHWNVLSTPIGGPSNAYSVDPVAPWVTLSNSNWINPYGDQTQPFVYTPGNNVVNPPLGTYVYEYLIGLKCLPRDCEQIGITMDYASDNGVEFKVNGVTIGQNPSLFAWSTISSIDHRGCAPFEVGVNHLTATVQNPHLWTGLLVEGQFFMVP